MISSGSNAQIKELVKLQKSARERRKKGLFVVEGIKLTKEAAAYGKLKKIYISEKMYSQNMDEEMGQLVRYGCEVVSDAVFRSISDTVTPQGVIGLAQIPVSSAEEIAEDERRSILLLDDLRDPGNMGTIIRTAEGAGMSGIILSRESVDVLNPKVVRATMGAIFRVPCFYAESLVEQIEALKEKDIPVYGTMMQGSRNYDSVDYTKGAGIVIGNEANGISKEVIGHLSGRVRIPMEGSLESLNAAVSAAILMYEIARQKRRR